MGRHIGVLMFIAGVLLLVADLAFIDHELGKMLWDSGSIFDISSWLPTPISIILTWGGIFLMAIFPTDEPKPPRGLQHPSDDVVKARGWRLIALGMMELWCCGWVMTSQFVNLSIYSFHDLLTWWLWIAYVGVTIHLMIGVCFVMKHKVTIVHFPIGDDFPDPEPTHRQMCEQLTVSTEGGGPGSQKTTEGIRCFLLYCIFFYCTNVGPSSTGSFTKRI